MRSRHWTPVALLLVAVAGGSLWMSYFGQTSPAWQVEFAHGFEPNSSKPEEIARWIAAGPKPWDERYGFWIEWARNGLGVIYLSLLLLHVYDKQKRPKNSRLFFVLMGVGVLIVAGMLVYYHFLGAPPKLAESDLWTEVMAADPEVWKPWWDQPGTDWETWAKEYAADPKKAASGQIDYLLYARPYAWYFPYSLVNFLAILFPIFFIAFRGARQDYATSSSAILTLEAAVDTAYPDPDIDEVEGGDLADGDVEEGASPDGPTPVEVPLADQGDHSIEPPVFGLIEKVPQVGRVIASAMGRLSWLLFFLGVGLLFEILAGFGTLAEKAVFFSILSFVILISGGIFLFPSIMRYGRVINRLRFALDCLPLASGAEPKVESASKTLDRYGVEKLIQTGVAFRLAIFVLGLVVAIITKS